jgi:hypothetical protein
MCRYDHEVFVCREVMCSGQQLASVLSSDVVRGCSPTEEEVIYLIKSTESEVNLSIYTFSSRPRQLILIDNFEI